MKNPYQLWETRHVEGPKDLLFLFDTFIHDNPEIGGFDTETTGLHIIKDKPFLIQFGWLVPNTEYGRVFTFYPTPENMKIFFSLSKKLKYLVAHNIKYDLNMLSNIGYVAEVQAMTNLIENTVVARLSLEALPTRNGGDSLKLKKLGAKYVHPDATRSEAMIDEELHKLNAERIKVLSAALKQFPLEGEFTPAGKQKYWGKGAIEKFLNDPTNDTEDLPENVRSVWLDWQEEYPEPTYEDVDRALMIKYGGEDIITMLEYFRSAMPFIIKREQLPILELESKCILPMYRMERIGLQVDRDYLEESRLKVKDYITKLRKQMHDLVGEKFTVGQHPTIKRIFKGWGIELEKDDKQALKGVMSAWELGSIPHEVAKRIIALRSLEKWYSTYIVRVQKNSAYDGRLYTQINSSGAVSGRMSCDVQQFPKDALKTLEGEELFHPRKAFTVKGGDYESIAYIDYDQIELVTQAHYTLLVSGGDLNLCRAYMPFRCRHYRTREVFDYRTSNGRNRWSERQSSGDSAWLDEEGKPWTKTDTHSMTAHKAFPEVPMDHPDFKKVYRPKGKTTNFAANYGASPKALIGQGFSPEDAKRLIDGYNQAFPGVIQYQKKIIKAHALKGYVHNHFGRRYYLSDANKAYTLANYVVQGSCADALKKAIIELDEFLADKQTNMVIPIHDEVQFDIYKGEEWVIPELEKIMAKAFDWCLVPVTAGVEITYDNWKNKAEY